MLDKKQCSLFSFQEAVETPCVKGDLSYGLPEGEGGMQWQQQRVRDSEIIYKYLCDICRKSVWLPGLLSPERGGTCVWEKIFLSYRRGVGWFGKWAEEQGNSRAVINEWQDRSGSCRNTWGFAAMEPSLHKNWYQMTQPYKSDTDHTMGMWLLLPN